MQPAGDTNNGTRNTSEQGDEDEVIYLRTVEKPHGIDDFANRNRKPKQPQDRSGLARSRSAPLFISRQNFY